MAGWGGAHAEAKGVIGIYLAYIFWPNPVEKNTKSWSSSAPRYPLNFTVLNEVKILVKLSQVKF